MQKGEQMYNRDELKEAMGRMVEALNNRFDSGTDLDLSETEYSGTIRLPYSATGAWNDVFNILALNGYRVVANVEPVKDDDVFGGTKQFIIIEFEEV